MCAFEEKQFCGHTLHESAKQEPFFSFFEDCGLERSDSRTTWILPHCISSLHVFYKISYSRKQKENIKTNKKI